MIRTRSNVDRLCAALSAVVACALLAACGQTGPAAQVASDASLKDVPADIQQALNENGISLTAVSALPSGIVSEEDAVQSVKSVPGVDDLSPSLYLVAFTDEKVGKLDGQDNLTSRSFENRLVWMIIFRQTVQPILGPAPPADQPATSEKARPTTYISDLAAFVDALSGEFLEAVTL